MLARSIGGVCPPSAFGRLHDPDPGHWVIRPDNPSEIERAEVGDALVQRTVCRAARREVAVSDAAALDPGARGHDVGL